MRILFLAVASVTGLLLVRRRCELAPWLAVVWLLSVVYLAFVIRAPYVAPRVVQDPFHAVKLALKNGSVGFLEGAVLNVLLFVPFGYLLPLLWTRVARWWKLLLCGLFVSLSIELLQLVTLRGMFDLDDLMNNTLGALLGWLCFARWRQCSRS